MRALNGIGVLINKNTFGGGGGLLEGGAKSNHYGTFYDGNVISHNF